MQALAELVLLVMITAGSPALASDIPIFGDSAWCLVSGNSVLFCDYSSYGGCHDANPDGACVMRPSR
jgi:hypothetical protein